MLQIGSGRLFSKPARRQNALRGILYSNLQLCDQRLETLAGSLSGTSSLPGRHLIFEMTEHIEDDGPEGPGALISSGVMPYLKEFADVASFGLNVICTPHSDLLARLTATRGYDTPQSLVRRVFDETIWQMDDGAYPFQTFVDDLMRLPRNTFRAAMSAIRGYVAGLQRLSDNPELAYAMLVASVESLAQDFDGHRAEWSDYTEDKRRPIDKALVRANDDVALKVRTAVLGNEHVSLGRRFRGFTIEHVAPSFFLTDSGHAGSLGRADLEPGLERAYGLRSSYLHKLSPLPRMLMIGQSGGDVMRIDREITLTFQGLSRLMRHAIMTFIARQPSSTRNPTATSWSEAASFRHRWPRNTGLAMLKTSHRRAACAAWRGISNNGANAWSSLPRP